MKKALLLVLVLISLCFILVRVVSLPIDKLLGAKERAGIKVLSVPDGADVYLNDQLVGKTPFENGDLDVKNYQVQVKNGGVGWQSSVRLTNGTLAVVNRELDPEASSSAGEVLTLEPGNGVFVNAWPSQSSIEVDGQDFGQTPKLVSIPAGDHTFILSHSGFLKRSIRAAIPASFRLNLSVDLALTDLNLSDTNTVAITVTPTVVVKSTPTGFLRVRDKPSLSGHEIGQVKPGDSLTLLEEAAGWDKVQLPDGKQGYVSAGYVEKKL